MTRSRGVFADVLGYGIASFGPVAISFAALPIFTYYLSTVEFGEFSLAKQKEAGRWSILFFYPADFTFV